MSATETQARGSSMNTPQYATPEDCRRVEIDGVTYFVSLYGVVFQLEPDTALGMPGYASVKFPSLAESQRVLAVA
jgi:hypothetical protein